MDFPNKQFLELFDFNNVGIPVNEEHHYPSNDFIDNTSGAQCFFHRHESKEIGLTQHFHFFRKWTPKVEEFNNHEVTTHIAALEISENFQPISWFTVNQWVTGDYLCLTSDFEFLIEHYNFNNITTKHNDKLLLWLEGIFLEGKKKYFNDLFALRNKNLEELFESKTQNILKNHEYEILSQINLK